VSQYHRRQLIEESFAQAEQIREFHLGNPQWNLFTTAAGLLADKAGFKRNFDFEDYRGGRFPDDDGEWADKHRERLQTEPVNVMSEWIDQHPRAREAVDTYCAAKAQEDLARMAQRARPSDLASPEEALALRRNRGRMM